MEELERNLAWSESILSDAERKQVKHWGIILWLRDLEDVAFEAEDVVRKFKDDQNRQLKLGRKIMDINDMFKHNRSFGTSIGLVHDLMALPFPPPSAFGSGETTQHSFEHDACFLGRDDELSAIVKVLTKDNPSHPYSILTIRGAVGMGKTRLAQQVYHHPHIKTHFPTLMWIHFPPVFTSKILLDNVLYRLTFKASVVDCLDDLLLKIREALAGKRVLLVLDDVWDQDKMEWEWYTFVDYLSMIFTTKENNICVIVTTRTSQVIPSSVHDHVLKGLSDHNCWSIIKDRGAPVRSSAYESVGKEIAKKCHGSPLVAREVGKALKRSPSYNDWVSIKDMWLTEAEQHEDNLLNLKYLTGGVRPSFFKRRRRRRGPNNLQS